MSATSCLPLPVEPRVPMPLVWRFASTALIAAFAMLLLKPFAVVELARAGTPAAQVGFFAFLAPLTMVVLILVLPRVAARHGRVWPVRLGLVAGAMAALGFATTDGFAAWCVLAVLMGMQFAVHWTSVDTVISENVPPGREGASIGLYQTLLAASVALGPVVASQAGLPLRELAAIALALMGASLLLTFGGLRRRIDAKRPASAARGGLFAFIRRHPLLLAVAFLAGLFEVGTTAMGAVQALGLGFAASAAVLVASVIAIGSFVAQVPIGRLADRYGAPALMRASAVVLVLAALGLWLAPAWPPLLWVLAALWGAFGGALQTLVYMHVAVSQRGEGVALGMVTMALGFTLGTLVGPGVGGVATQLSPSQGLAWMLLALAVAVLALVARRGAFRTDTP